MNKQDNKLALSVVAVLISGIALIYTLIMYHNIIFAVVGISLLFLITAYMLTQNIIAFISMRNKSMNVQIKNMVDDLSSQLESMSSSQAQIGKATYLYTKQAAQTVTALKDNYTEGQKTLCQNISSLSDTQNKATKLMIKYDRNNTMKLIATVKEIRNQLSETMVQGFDQIQPNNDEVVAALQTIVDYLKSQPNSMDQTMGVQLNNVAHELQNISNSIQSVHLSASNTIQTPSVNPAMPVQTTDMQPEQIVDTPSEQTADMQPEQLVDTPLEQTADMQSEQIVDTIDEEPATETIPEEEPFTPTFTLVGKSTEKEPALNEEELSEPEPISKETTAAQSANVTPVSEDPNKQLSPGEIAALFAAAEPAPKKEEKADAEPVSEETAATESVNVTSVSEDPNKQLSPDEIAALFAAAESTPKNEEKADAEPVSEETTAAQSANITPVSDDPNKQLSPDEIAALFAQMG